MEVLRTPDDRFNNLPDFPWAPKYLQVTDALRMHYVDEGPREGAPVLMLHGEPTWSYLYRKMIPVFAQAGYRAIAPDLIGFGRSDKPTAITDYSYQSHMDWLVAFVEALDLRDITLVCQDWGSILGLRLAAEHPERFSRITVGNGILPIAAKDQPVPLPFYVWRAFARYSPWFSAGGVVQAASVSKLPPDVVAAYNAPFPEERYKAGARAFPRLVPTHAGDPAIPANRAAWKTLGEWQKPVLTVFGERDPLLGKADAFLHAHIPGARGQPHARLHAGHFIQEDQGQEWARRAVEWMQA